VAHLSPHKPIALDLQKQRLAECRRDNQVSRLIGLWREDQLVLEVECIDVIERAELLSEVEIVGVHKLEGRAGVELHACAETEGPVPEGGVLLLE